MPYRTIQNWLDEYGESHRNPTNKLVHWICVPTIFFSITGLLYSLKLGVLLTPTLELNVGMLVLLLVILYYFRLSVPLAFGMLLFSLGCFWLCRLIETRAAWPLWQVSVALFVAAWIGQFWGHQIEGKKPSFLKDLQFLMIGPAWLMHFVYRKLGIQY